MVYESRGQNGIVYNDFELSVSAYMTSLKDLFKRKQKATSVTVITGKADYIDSDKKSSFLKGKQKWKTSYFIPLSSSLGVFLRHGAFISEQCFPEVTKSVLAPPPSPSYMVIVQRPHRHTAGWGHENR